MTISGLSVPKWGRRHWITVEPLVFGNLAVEYCRDVIEVRARRIILWHSFGVPYEGLVSKSGRIVC
jgi:hypothetical protein